VIRGRLTRIGLVAGALVIAGLSGSALADASSVNSVGEVPAGYTPWLLQSTPNQYVHQLVPCRNTMYAVGTISAIGQGSHTYARGNAFSFSRTTGAVTGWDPEVNGMVHSIALSPDCSTAYLGGTFTSVGGQQAENVAAVDTTTGALIRGFAHSANHPIDTVQYINGMVLVGGPFTSINGFARSHLASLDPATGAPTSYANLSITGSYPMTTTRVFNAQLSHARDRLLIEGVFTSIDGRARQQVAILDIGASKLTVDPWSSPELTAPCQVHNAFYARAANWSPDDKTIYVATTGGRPLTGPGSKRRQTRHGLCDAASAFPSRPKAVQHLWINYTGCDSYYAVVADKHAVYVAGHERWSSNPFGCDHAGTGAISRPGIGSLDPQTGATTSWNPTRSRGFGADDLILTPEGLWVASDNFTDGRAQYCGHVGQKGGICLLLRQSAR
jgi:hypothetical protein